MAIFFVKKILITWLVFFYLNKFIFMSVKDKLYNYIKAKKKIFLSCNKINKRNEKRNFANNWVNIFFLFLFTLNYFIKNMHYLYIYIYKTETYKALTIFHVYINNLYKNINLDRTKNKQRKKETHVENRTQKRKKKKDLVVFEWYLITNLPRLGFIFTLSSLYLVHVSSYFLFVRSFSSL